jgi:hypothetical protein
VPVAIRLLEARSKVSLRARLAAACRRLAARAKPAELAQNAQPSLVVYTAIFGGRDTLKEPSILTPGARYVCFTDEPLRSDVWEIVRAAVRVGGPRRTSRWYKLLPHRHFQADYSLWIDGSFRVNVDVRPMIERYLGQADLAVYRHPYRDCIFELSEELIRHRLDDPARIRQQVERYRAEGLPEHAGLIPGGVLLRRHTPAIERFNEAWWHEYEHGSVRDVLGLRYATWRTAIPLAFIDGHVLENPELQFLDHRSQRLAEEYCPEAWARLVPPRSVATFPADLANTALEYAGVHQDGWLAESAFFGLDQPSAPSLLVVRGMVPLLDDPGFTTELQVLVDGQEVARQQPGLGDFEVRVPAPPGAGRRRVGLRFSASQQLPEAVPRQVSALLRFVGFEESAEASSGR